MTRATPWVILALVCLSAASANAQTTDMYSGRWKLTSMKVDVTIESWGENCGPRPRSYSSNRVQSVDIYSRGEHLIFSKGGVRTDRCWSPNNPRIETITSSASTGKWKRVCQTPKSDPKFERGEYTLTAIDKDALDYLAISKFEWTLKGDHCTASLVEKRRYVRETTEQIDPPSRPEPRDTIEIETDAKDVFPDEACSPSGPVKRISMIPESARLNPGDKVCFKVFGFDADDCRHRLSASFRVTQGGQVVPGLVQQNGCFIAGQTAAESEGIYEVTGRTGNHAASSRVEVVFPDLGELIAARLSPLEDLEEDAPDQAPQPTASPKPAPPSSAQTRAPGASPSLAPVQPEKPDSPTALIVTVAVGALFAGGFALVFLVLRRRRTDIGDEEDLDSWPEDTQGSDARDPHRDSPKTSVAAGPRTLTCPTCGEEFADEAKFCPHDRTLLVPAAAGSRLDRGMVCPLCHRGYEPDARFCPHDSAALVDYKQWRARQKNGGS